MKSYETFHPNMQLYPMIQEEFFQLGKQYSENHFCAIGYAAFSSGHVTDEMIQEYLEKHEKHSNHHDDDFEWTNDFQS